MYLSITHLCVCVCVFVYAYYLIYMVLPQYFYIYIYIPYWGIYCIYIFYSFIHIFEKDVHIDSDFQQQFHSFLCTVNKS